ncbi:MAG TPA: bifunctional cytidylyltransferase/SDR family oxidoreductase [Candidatus Limnocylindrales bacterium]|nr:bifunctional cytidylyltransferase/SDR family oxidoreductase [Candidatus Limnocylindrales bacterium]
MQIHAIILAGGDGNRFGGELPKQFVRLAGDPILLRTVRRLHGANIGRLVVVAHPRWLGETRDLIEAAALPGGMDVIVVPGGTTRNESTRNGLAALGGADDDVVLVHDAVRPLLPLEVIQRAIEPIISGRADATDTVIPSADTLVIVDGEDVIEIPDRSRYRRGQTPQTFRVGVLAKAYAAAEAAGDLSATDDCSLVLRYVPEARMLAVAGDEINMKITTRIDMVMADRMLQMAVLVPGPDPTPTATIAGTRLLVVGGTNGIGRAIAEAAEGQGATAEVAGSSTGLDVRDYAAVAALTGAAAGRMGGLDHVVCTAGLLRIGPLAGTDPASFAEIIDVNLTGSLNVARAAYPYLRATRGSITFFASSSFTRGRPDYVPYSASKAAVVNMTQGLADEWAPDGIRVNAVSPERTDTPMRRIAFPDEDRTGMLGAADVALATLRLLGSDLTGQVVDVKRSDVAGAG